MERYTRVTPMRPRKGGATPFLKQACPPFHPSKHAQLCYHTFSHSDGLMPLPPVVERPACLTTGTVSDRTDTSAPQI